MTLLLLAMCSAASFFNPALLQGVGAAAVNPAFLGCPDRQGFSCRLVDLDAGVYNNSFTVGQYNRYTGAYLDEAAKADILASIPASGMLLDAGARVAAAEFGWGNVAATLSTELQGRAIVPHQLFGLALRGNELNRRYQLADAQASGQILARAGLAAGAGLGSHLALGVGFNYLRGLACAELTGLRASLTTTPSDISADGMVAYRTASGGSGYSLQLGLATWFGRWRLGLACSDIGAAVTWRDGVRDASYTVRLAPGNAYEIRTERLFTSEYDAGPGATFTTRLPIRIGATAGYRLARWVNCGAAGELRVAPAGDVAGGWEVQSTLEFLPLHWLPVSCELGYDSNVGTSVGASLGAVLGRFVIAPRARYLSGFLSDARGLELGLSVSYEDRASRFEPDVLRIRYGVD